FEAQFDYVQVMGIAKVGFQGEPFDKRALYLVERLRQRYPELPLQVDGAVTLENIALLVKAGANRLVVGHDIWDSSDPLEEIKKLKAEANR
ncbi:MAG TPA: ribulose-phosphate 3-epimerase, partial [Candidatus Paceibacterota bacterium]